MPAFTDAQVASYIQNNNLDAAGIAQAAQVFGLSPTQISAAQGLLSSGDASVGAASQAYQQAVAANPSVVAQNQAAYNTALASSNNTPTVSQTQSNFNPTYSGQAVYDPSIGQISYYNNNGVVLTNSQTLGAGSYNTLNRLNIDPTSYVNAVQAALNSTQFNFLSQADRDRILTEARNFTPANTTTANTAYVNAGLNPFVNADPFMNSSGNRPSIAEFMSKTGVDFKTASDILSSNPLGATGSDTLLNWNAIMSSSDPVNSYYAGLRAINQNPEYSRYASQALNKDYTGWVGANGSLIYDPKIGAAQGGVVSRANNYSAGDYSGNNLQGLLSGQNRVGTNAQPMSTIAGNTTRYSSVVNALNALKQGTINVDQFKTLAKSSGIPNDELLSNINSILGKNYTLQNLTEWLANPNPSYVPTASGTGYTGVTTSTGNTSGGIVSGLFGGVGGNNVVNTTTGPTAGSSGYSSDYWDQVRSYQDRYFGGSGGAQTDASWNALRDLATSTGTGRTGTPTIDTSIASQPVTAKADYYNSLRSQGWSDSQIRQAVEGDGAKQSDDNWKALVDLAQSRRNTTGTIKEGLPVINASIFYGSPESKAAYYNNLLSQGWTDSQIRAAVDRSTGGSTDYGMLSNWYNSGYTPPASTSYVPRYNTTT